MAAASPKISGENERLFKADDASAGQRLDRWLAAQNPDLSRSRIKQLIDQGHIEVDGTNRIDAALILKRGQKVRMAIPTPIGTALKAQPLDLDIVFEDAHLVVVNKPAGLVVHPAAGNPDRTLVNALLAHCGDSLLGIGGELRPGIVHRLDKGTSGLLVAAKSGNAHANLAQQFAVHSIERAYDALVWGLPTPRKGIISGQIGRSVADRKKMAVRKAGGKYAETHYEVIETFGLVATWVRCMLKTGRTHQIRVHMTSRGNPLIGDPTYGTATAKLAKSLDQDAVATIRAMSRQALHARVLGFVHPVTGKKMRFEKEPPNDFANLAQALRIAARGKKSDKTKV